MGRSCSNSNVGGWPAIELSATMDGVLFRLCQVQNSATVGWVKRQRNPTREVVPLGFVTSTQPTNMKFMN